MAGCIYEGIPLATDKLSISHLHANLTMLEATDPEGTLDWKCSTGWIELNVEQLRMMYATCFNHVQKCFTAEKLVYDELMSIVDIRNLIGDDVVSGDLDEPPEDEDGDVEASMQFEPFDVMGKYKLALEQLGMGDEDD